MDELLQKYLWIYLVAVSVVAFISYGIDKSKAKRNKWRIPEKFLLGISLVGGFVGSFLAMQTFRHKTKHWYFYAVVIISTALWGFLLFKLYTA